MNARELIGQRLVAGFPGTEIDDDLRELIAVYKVANIILFKHNIVSNEQTRRLCQELRALIREHTGVEAMITIDQEGGMVTRLDEDGVNVPGAMAIAATGDSENAWLAGKLTGQQLRDLYVDFDLAPDLDVNSNKDNPVIGVRSYGDDPYQVADYGAEMIRGLAQGGVLTSAKHFPGHGDTAVDSHLGLPRIEKSLEELEQCELIPFIRAIKEGVSAITTTHILFPKLEKTWPATMSRRIITDLLRNKLGFEGMIISDCMEMQAIQKFYGTVEGVKKAMQAGVDLVFISHTASLVRQASDELVKALAKGELDTAETEASVSRIAKYRGIGVRGADEPPFDAAEGRKRSYELLKKTITPVQVPGKQVSGKQVPGGQLPEMGSNPLFVGSLPFRATNASSAMEGELDFAGYLNRNLGGEAAVMSPNPEQEEIKALVKKAEAASCVIIGTYNGNLNRGQLDVVGALAETNERIIVFALRNPYDLCDLPKHVYGYAVYEYTTRSLRAIKELLQGEFLPEGQLPVGL